MSGGGPTGRALQSLRSYMSEHKVAGCIASHPLHVGYLSGYFPPSNCFSALLVAADDAVLVAPSSHGPEATNGLRTVLYEDYSLHRTVDTTANASRALETALTGLPFAHAEVGLEPAFLPAAYWETLRRNLNPAAMHDVNPLLRTMRTVKAAEEVQAIEHAATTCERIFASIEAHVKAGAAELDAYHASLRVVSEAVGGPPTLEGDFVSGERTEQIGGPPTSRTLSPGELMIIDILPKVGSYWADCTRTYVVGRPDQEVVDRHGILEEALQAGERAIEPGLPAKEAYWAVKRVLELAGWGNQFPHHAGHGVGLAPLEEPYLIPGSAEVLQEGMVVTLEPGMYAAGRGGMRLEDTLVVTADGCRRLCMYPRKLIVI